MGKQCRQLALENPSRRHPEVPTGTLSEPSEPPSPPCTPPAKHCPGPTARSWWGEHPPHSTAYPPLQGLGGRNTPCTLHGRSIPETIGKMPEHAMLAVGTWALASDCTNGPIAQVTHGLRYTPRPLTITLTFLLLMGGCVVLSCSFSAGAPFSVDSSSHSDTNVCHRCSYLVPLSQQGCPTVGNCHRSLTIWT